MEEIEIRDALRRHVSSAEPPMRLTATTLLATGRRRHWWRLSTVAGSAGVATTLAVAGVLGLLPPGGGSPWADDGPCKLPLAQRFSPLPSAPPAPNPSGPPTPWPTFDPSPAPTAYPTYQGPTVYPTYEAPTAYPTYEAPSAYPTAEESVIWASPGRPAFPTATPPADRARAEAMECHLRNGLMALAPDAAYAPVTDHGPMKVYTAWSDPFAMEGVAFCANAIVVDPRETVQLTLCAEPTWQRPTGPEHGWSYREDKGAVLTHLRRDDGLLLITVYLKHSMVSVSVTGTLFTPRQLEDLVNAPELEVNR